MLISIPIYVEEQTSAEGAVKVFLARPVFQPEPMAKAEKLSRALNRLAGELRELLQELGREPRHDLLAAWTLNPLLEETTIELRLELKSGSHLKRFFLVGYSALDRKLYFTPTLPEVHFEVLPGQKLTERATAVFTHHFRELERGEEAFDLDALSLQGKARVAAIEINIKPSALAKKPRMPGRAFLFGGPEKKDGEQELRKAGRYLQSLYPDDLERAVGRDEEVMELARLLESTDRRPVLLVGPRKTGKTAILHELAWRMCERKKERFAGGREIWLLAPMRLISGMSYLGEWENRVLAILEYAAEKDRVLYFDDLLGLFTAGVSCASDLNVAEVLRPALEKRSVRVVAEITPEAWRVLRERDRAFADLFHVLPVHEPIERETLRILIDVTRRLEDQHHCTFGLDVVPTAFELYRRFAGDAAFPGKAAGFLRRLAVRQTGSHVGQSIALDQFHQESGLQTAFLDRRQQIRHADILTQLKAKLLGQDRVLEAFADVLITLKAQLNDPRRPLGTFLLLGPTGVGKTQSAKVLARFLFNSEERLLRFDMNEYVDGVSASRLAGTPAEPDGLLTGAIRRQPFSVVLFDEIEKAAPEVFDLLLAVLDEGRLTDALGRVADFTNCVILLTSNLGVRECRSRLGFVDADGRAEESDAIFVEAAEKFFRPEFFNRLDRIIPFRALERVHLEGIARQLIAEVFSREGLRRRECLLKIAPEAIGRLVELGRDPQLGARALKRVVEREVAAPLAERLAGLPPGTPTIATLRSEGGQLGLELKELRPVSRSVFWPEPSALSGAGATPFLHRANAALDRIEAMLEQLAPKGIIELGNLAPETGRYFSCREQLKKADRLVQAAERSSQPRRRSSSPVHLPKTKPTKFLVRQYISGNPKLGRLRDAVSLQLEMGEWEAAESVEVLESAGSALAREIALLEAMVQTPWDDRPMALIIQPLEERDVYLAFSLARCYHDFFSGVWGSSATFLFEQWTAEECLLKRIFDEPLKASSQAVFLTGFNVRRLLPIGISTVLVRRKDGSMGLLLLHALDASSLKEAEGLTKALLNNPEQDFGDTSDSVGPVLHLITEDKTITDFRTGLVVPAQPSEEEFRALMLWALPLPPEMKP